MHRTHRRAIGVGAALATLLMASGVANAHPEQHGGPDGHLEGDGAFGKIDLVGQVEVTQTDGLVADVAVFGDYAYLANWGEPDCAANEAGGQRSPDAGAWVIDISDPSAPEEVGFIAMPQDTRPGEGMQVTHLETAKFSGDVLVMNAEGCGKNYKGGFMLYDVTDPTNPVKLKEGFGDRTGGDAHQTHSAFVWQHGDRAYLVAQDEEDLADVDIYDITNPKSPRLITELDLNDYDVVQPELGLTDSFLHDMTVRCFDGTAAVEGFQDRCIMVASYWDGGYVLLDVTDPAAPVFMGDTDFAAIDPELLAQTGAMLTPEGNAHQAEFTSDGRFFIGTDEDFDPYRTDDFVITSGPNAGAYDSTIVAGGGGAPALLDDLTLDGTVVYGGYACPSSAPLPSPEDVPGYLEGLAPGEETVLVLQRGPVGDPSAPEEPCFPGEKVEQAASAGWDAVVIVNRHPVPGEVDAPYCGSGAFVGEPVVAVCISHETFHALFDLDPLEAPWTYPEDLAIGTVGADIQVGSLFDGWGYVHLFDAATLEDLDTFAIPEAMDPTFATGFGDLTVHEVATDPTDPSMLYLSYYAGGFRALQIVCGGVPYDGSDIDTASCELVEVGGYLDPEGNNFWGVEVILNPDDDPAVDGDEVLVLASDRDYGLFVFVDP